MNLGLEGKQVLITGGSKGIGLAVAHAFAAEGAGIVIASRNQAMLEQAAGKVRRKHNAKVAAHPADLSLAPQRTRLHQAFPDADILVNNAGAIPSAVIRTCLPSRPRLMEPPCARPLNHQAGRGATPVHRGRWVIGGIADIDMERWQQAWQLKVLGYIHLCQLYVARMKARRSGIIVNIIGMGGRSVRPDYICGAAGNGALI